jgi:hypothetical protein
MIHNHFGVCQTDRIGAWILDHGAVGQELSATLFLLQASHGGSETCQTDIKMNARWDSNRKKNKLDNALRLYMRVLSTPRRNMSDQSHLEFE